jgi:hypothetical protein
MNCRVYVGYLQGRAIGMLVGCYRLRARLNDGWSFQWRH